MCREAGALFYCGAATQIGSAGGALTAFVLVTQVIFVGFHNLKEFSYKVVIFNVCILGLLNRVKINARV